MAIGQHLQNQQCPRPPLMAIGQHRQNQQCPRPPRMAIGQHSQRRTKTCEKRSAVPRLHQKPLSKKPCPPNAHKRILAARSIGLRTTQISVLDLPQRRCGNESRLGVSVSSLTRGMPPTTTLVCLRKILKTSLKPGSAPY